MIMRIGTFVNFIKGEIIMEIILFVLIIGTIAFCIGKLQSKGWTIYEILVLEGAIAFIVILVMLGYFYLKSSYLF